MDDSQFEALARLQQLCDQSGPAGLVSGADAAAGVAVKILVEQDVIAEVLVVLQAWVLREDGSLAVLVLEEYSGQALGDFARRLLDGDEISRNPSGIRF